MATPPKFMRFPFAATGDKEAIPDEAQASGSLSYSEGFGLDYERDPTKDAKAKRMPRGGTNQVLYDTTSNIQQYQLYGVPYWYEAASNGGTAIQYQKNAMVRFATGNSENIYISLKDNNTDIPTIEASWFLFQPYNATLLSRLSIAPFVPIESMVLTIPPVTPVQGKAYLVPANATGLWTGKVGQLAEWDGKSWLFTVTPNGHSVGLSDGRVFTKVDGSYIEKIALDSQSGKWNFAEAGGTANELTATLNPVPATLPAGTSINLLIKTNNTEAPTLNLNGLGAKNIIRADNTPCEANDLIAGSIVELLFDGNSFQISGLYKSRLSAHKTVVFSNVGVTNFVVPEGVYLVTVEIWGGGGGGGAAIGSGSAGSGGGGGGYVRSAVPVLPNQVIPVTVGVGGTGGITDPAANLYNGKSGSASSFGLFATANGGGGGFLGNNEIVGRAGAGGSGFGNGMKANGGGGGFGWVGAALAGGTGAAAYGVSITSPTMRAPGSNGSYPGGGGGGGSEGNRGGAGANGLVVIQF